MLFHAPVQPSSEFAKAYSQGLHKSKFWEPVYEDSLNLIARLPAVAAMIYRNTYKGGKLIKADPKLDWAANLAHMMGAQPSQQPGLGIAPPHSFLCHPCVIQSAVSRLDVQEIVSRMHLCMWHRLRR